MCMKPPDYTTMPTKDLRPYENNPRKNDNAVHAVAESIKEFGFRQPIVVQEDGTIICGHTRWKAAKKLGMSEVPVHVVTDLTPEQIKAYRIADNSTRDLSDWDDALLLDEMSGIFEIDMDRFGVLLQDEKECTIEESEVKPFIKAFILVTADINNYDRVLKVLRQLDDIEGASYEQRTHTN